MITDGILAFLSSLALLPTALAPRLSLVMPAPSSPSPKWEYSDFCCVLLFAFVFYFIFYLACQTLQPFLCGERIIGLCSWCDVQRRINPYYAHTFHFFTATAFNGLLLFADMDWLCPSAGLSVRSPECANQRRIIWISLSFTSPRVWSVWAPSFHTWRKMRHILQGGG